MIEEFSLARDLKFKLEPALFRFLHASFGCETPYFSMKQGDSFRNFRDCNYARSRDIGDDNSINDRHNFVCDWVQFWIFQNGSLC